MIQYLKEVVNLRLINSDTIEVSVYVLDKQIKTRKKLTKEDTKLIVKSLITLRQTESFTKALNDLKDKVERYYKEENVINEELKLSHLKAFKEDIKQNKDVEVLIICYNVLKTRKKENTIRVRVKNIQYIEELKEKIEWVLEANDIWGYKLENVTNLA